MHWAWQLGMIADAERKLKQGLVSEAELRRQLEEFACKLFDLVVCPNCELMFSSFLIDNCPRCGWNTKKHSF